MINRYIQCHHGRHHGYRESGSGENDEDRLVLTRCKYPADEPFYDRGGYVALCDESSDHLDPHMGQGVAESGECDAAFQSRIVECHDIHKDEYHDTGKCEILKFCLWHCDSSS